MRYYGTSRLSALFTRLLSKRSRSYRIASAIVRLLNRMMRLYYPDGVRCESRSDLVGTLRAPIHQRSRGLGEDVARGRSIRWTASSFHRGQNSRRLIRCSRYRRRSVERGRCDAQRCKCLAFSLRFLSPRPRVPFPRMDDKERENSRSRFRVSSESNARPPADV